MAELLEPTEAELVAKVEQGANGQELAPEAHRVFAGLLYAWLMTGNVFSMELPSDVQPAAILDGVYAFKRMHPSLEVSVGPFPDPNTPATVRVDVTRRQPGMAC